MTIIVGKRANTARLKPKLSPKVQQIHGIETCPQCNCIPDKIKEHTSTITYCVGCGFVPTTAIRRNDTDKAIRLAKDRQSQNPISLPTPMDQQKPKTNSQIWLTYSKASDQTEKNFALTLAEVTRIAHALSTERPLALQAAEICGQAFEKGLVRGSSLPILAAAAVYVAGRLASVPITVEEVAAESGLAKSVVVHCFRRLQRKLGLSFVPPSVQAHALKILRLLSISPDGKLTIIANQLLETAEKSGVTHGRNPAAVAAAAIYVASLKMSEGSRGLTQRKLAQVSNVTETTIRRVCQNLNP